MPPMVAAFSGPAKRYQALTLLAGAPPAVKRYDALSLDPVLPDGDGGTAPRSKESS